MNIENIENYRGDIDINIFKGYDIRGDAQITPQSPKINLREEDAFLIGQAIGSQYTSKKQIPTVLITSDHRPSSNNLRSALAKGFASSGANVRVTEEPTPTGATSWIVLKKKETFDISVQITGSHNPYYNNGFKITSKQDEDTVADINGIPQALYGQGLKQIYHNIKNDDVVKDGNGTIENVSVVSDYQEGLTEHFKNVLADRNGAFKNKFRVVLDAGNGLGTKSVAILKNLGVELHEMFTDLHGEFPNHPADPSTHEGTIMAREKVQELNKNVQDGEIPWLALVFDGDGDRCGIIDEEGGVIYPERILAIMYIRFLLENEKGFKLLASLGQNVGLALDVRGTGVIEDLINDYKENKGYGIVGEYIACGYPNHRSYVRKQIKKIDEIIAKENLSEEDKASLQCIQKTYTSAESSGHFFYGTCSEVADIVVDDGIFSCIQLLNIVDTLDKYEAVAGLIENKERYSLTDIFTAIKWRPVSNEIRGQAPYEEQKKNEVVQNVTDSIKSGKAQFSKSIKGVIEVDGIRAVFEDGSFFLVRASQTSPKLTYKFEAYTQERLVEVIAETIELMKAYEADGVSVAELQKEWELQKNS